MLWLQLQQRHALPFLERFEPILPNLHARWSHANQRARGLIWNGALRTAGAAAARTVFGRSVFRPRSAMPKRESFPITALRESPISQAICPAESPCSASLRSWLTRSSGHGRLILLWVIFLAYSTLTKVRCTTWEGDKYTARACGDPNTHQSRNRTSIIHT